MTGETVTVIYKDGAAGADAFNQEQREPITAQVSNVLVQPLDGADLAGVQDSNRPDGTRARLKLFFPKAYVYEIDPGIFRGAEIEVRGKRYKVIGKPGYYDKAACPTDWCMAVNVEAVNG
ncbi:MAG: hypothetical protein FWF33_00500 [Clostridiales bacterium]|nr:hypothetical protein [Clostridiales bacterium]